MTPLISVHVAKAGGTALGRALQNAYGSSFRADYHDNPADPTSQRILDPRAYFQRNERLPDGAAAVHGHFHPGKFDTGKDIALCTMLRHPVQNIISIYWFWKSMQGFSDALHAYCIRNKLTIMDAAYLPLLRFLYSVTYFGGFDMRRFDVIGRYEDRSAFGKRLSDVVGRELDLSNRMNVTPAHDDRQDMETDIRLRRKLTDILIDDVRFYEAHAR